MKIIKIEPNSNGSHDNQSGGHTLPDGWAVVPDTLETPNFPFGTIQTAEVDGIMTVTSWTAGEMPELETVPEVVDPATETMDIAVDNAYRIRLLELGLTD